MSEQTSRFALPLLEAGQAQKEVQHNEAIVALELLAQPIAETIGDNVPPGAPAEGASWIVGTAPSGAWAGHAGALASWTGGGWRFAEAIEGMGVFVKASRLSARWRGGAWTVGELNVARIMVGADQVIGPRQNAIATPAGGAAADVEARAAIAQILDALRLHGLIAT